MADVTTIELKKWFPGNLSELLRDEIKLPPKNSEGKKQGLIILLRGAPGTGKTTLALQIASQLILKNKICKYYSIEQNKEAIKSKFSNMTIKQIFHLYEMNDKECAKIAYNSIGIPIDKISSDKTLIEQYPDLTSIANTFVEKLQINEYISDDDNKIDTGMLFSSNLDKWIKTFFELIDDKSSSDLIILDGLATLNNNQKSVIKVEKLFDLLRKKTEISIINFEPINSQEEDNLDYLADMVIHLREQPIQGTIPYMINEMHIIKARYQDPARGWHQYKIRSWGLEIFPSIHFLVHLTQSITNSYKQSLKCIENITPFNQQSHIPDANTTSSIIDGLIGNITNDSVTALFGARNTFKTDLCLDFLKSGALNDKANGLLVSLIDNYKNLNNNLVCPRNACGKNECPHKCKKLLHIFHQRPGCITPAEFLYYLKKRLYNQTQKIKRLAFWDLTQMDYRFPMFIDDRMFLPAMMDLLKKSRSIEAPREFSPDESLKSIIMGGANTKYSRALSAMADNVLYCWRDNAKIKAKPVDDKINKQIDHKNKINLDYENKLSYLLIYIDRRESPSDRTHQFLYRFPIYNGRLELPRKKWTPDDFIAYESKFELASHKIRLINQQQGLPHYTPFVGDESE